MAIAASASSIVHGRMISRSESRISATAAPPLKSALAPRDTIITYVRKSPRFRRFPPPVPTYGPSAAHPGVKQRVEPLAPDPLVAAKGALEPHAGLLEHAGARLVGGMAVRGDPV